MLKEYRSFLFHNLTNHKKITNNCVCFVTAFRSILPVQSEIEMILAFVVLSRLLLFGFVFLREFNPFFGSHVVSSCFLGGSRLEARGIAGTAA